MVEDSALELPQWFARLQAELLGKHVPPLAVNVERLGLPPRTVEREHQLAAQPLAERFLADERLQIRDDFGVAPQCQVGLDPLLERAEPHLLKPPPLVLDHGDGVEVLERLALARAREPC